MRILITGGAGFIGSATALFLQKRYHKVMVLDNFSTGKSENLFDFHGSVESCDILDINQLNYFFDLFRPDAVIHLAAQSAITTALKDPKRDLEVNAVGTLNVLKTANKFAVQRFVFSSTSAVYGKGNAWGVSSKEDDKCYPDTPYGISKLAAEHYIRQMFPVGHAILRYANIYGPRQQPVGQNQVIARAFRHFLYGDSFKVVGNGRQKRDFVYVDDIAYMNWLAVTTGSTGTYNVCNGSSYSVMEMLAHIEEYFEVKGYAWEHEEFPDLRGDVNLNSKKTEKTFGWKPSVDHKEGIRLTAEWWKSELGHD